MKNQKKAIILGLFVVMFWSTVATAFKIALAETGVIQLLTVSSLTAAIICLFELIRTGKLKSIKVFYGKRELLFAALGGLLNPFLYYLVLFKAYSLLPAQIAQPLNYSWQIVLILFMALFFKQKIRGVQFIGLFVSFAGIIMLSLNSNASAEGSLSTLGIFLALGSAFIWASYWILKMKETSDPVASLFMNFLFGSIYLIVLMIITGVELPNLKAILASVYVGTFEMGLTFIFWIKALNLATNRVALTQITYLSPALSLILIVLVLGEPFTLLTVLGLASITAGIIISTYQKKS